MRYVVSRVLTLLSVAVLLVPVCHAKDALRVSESLTQAKLRDGTMLVSLGVENTSAQLFRAHVEIELIDPKGESQGRTDRDLEIPNGVGKIHLEITLANMKAADLDTVFWYRLRYKISAAESAGTPFEPVSGIFSVSEVAPEMFELEVAYPTEAKPGASFQAVVLAVQPATLRPVGGVKIQATLDVSDTNTIAPLKATTTTDSRGYARVDFSLPLRPDSDMPTLSVTGNKGGYTATVSDENIYTYRFTTFLLNSDKPLYQPGQTLHARVLAFGPDRRAVAGEPLKFRVYDSENTLVYKTDLETSRFGIASADWPIPANQRLGSYTLRADFAEADSEDSGGRTTVNVSRYELPNFSVSAKPDRLYYLPNQNAEIDVHADYLFGQPLIRGHVRVVRESDRQWNFREQKWDIDEEEAYEGDTDSSGGYIARLDLTKERKELSDEDYVRFRDFGYTAYFTDPSSGRTEHRRFDVRLTKESIHIYVISPGRPVGNNVADLYVSTFYADGAPAPCEVTIRAANVKSGVGAHHGQLLRTIRTNRYGVAKVFGLTLPDVWGSDDELSALFHATDGKGVSGTHVEDLRFYGTRALSVDTDKALYRPNDPIEVHLVSSDPDATAVVQAIGDMQFVASQIVRMHHGRASVTFAPSDKYQGAVTIVAYELGLSPAGKFGETSANGAHTVLFPHDTSLTLDVHMSKATYHPGEEARVDFRVHSPQGDSAPGALGLVVVDKAVEERERTDEDLRADSGFYAFAQYWNRDSELAGIHRADLDKLDLSKPLPDGLELVAEILLQRGSDNSTSDGSSVVDTDLHRLFGSLIDPPLAPVISGLRLQTVLPTPPDGADGIRRFLGSTQLPTLRDPWGTAYRATILPVGPSYEIEIDSAGPDQRFDTPDDFKVHSTQWPYFTQYDRLIQKVVDDFHKNTGGFVRDIGTLKTELLRNGLDFDSLRDPWKHPYQAVFGIDQTVFTVEVRSAGPDGRFSTVGQDSVDDIVVSRVATGYFDDTRIKMDRALDRYFRGTQRFPQKLDDLVEAFHAAGIEWDRLHDPWGHPYYATFRQEARYSDDVTVQSYAEYQAGQHTTTRPVTSEINFIDIRSGGPDGKRGTPDDFEAAEFSRASYAAPQAQPGSAPGVIFSGELGAISGLVTDASGAVIQGTHVTARRDGSNEIYDSQTEGDGRFLLRNLKPGLYQVSFFTAGFRNSVFTGVPVMSSAVTELNATLQVGSVAQTVTVESVAESVQTQSSTVGEAARVISATGKMTSGPAAVATPRLRDYFPETLLWQPEVVTDSHGAAHLSIPLADSITTWELKAIASTVDGRIGTAEKEVRAFQPFFADQDLPQFLTAGDEIGLPVVVRNYLDLSEQVELKLSREPWLTFLGDTTQLTAVAANDSARVIFHLRADAPIKDGKQRVTAVAKGASDAIEKKTTVRPFGEERTEGVSQMLRDSAILNISIPQNALPGSAEAELKIYPNLMAHVWEAMEAILERPYGCGEQTISSTYPSILLLRYAKQAGRESAPETARARRYAQLGYDRLLSYAAADGGFTYWGRGDPDLALTAYALMFLNDAKDVIPVDDSVSQSARSWLLNKIMPDGHWQALEYWNKTEDSRRSAMLTAYIARVLAIARPSPAGDGASKQPDKLSEQDLAKALAWLGPRTEQQDEPYLIASYALALLNSGGDENRAPALRALKRLQSLARTEGDTAYWSLETNTPFYGWGRAGRLETTALVVEALERGEGTDPESDRSYIDRGTLFLLRNQDRYGIWYSTQATINVLRALAASISSPSAATPSGSQASVLVDGKPAATVALPPGNEMSAPVTADLSEYLGPGVHRIEIHRPAGAAEASVQLAESYYVPWSGMSADESTHLEKDSAEALRLTVAFDKTNTKIGEPINCTVKAERVDFRGYGMMLAEIGLPPGAEVDRASLDKAMTSSGWDINQFDVLPDRVIVYLWPRAGGTTFSFAFKTRFGINAETARSVLYDYYNPDAQAIVPPARLVAQ
jgi:hypothetical protein